MKKPLLESWVRIVMVLCGLMLIAVLFVPMWRIDLSAPQYPEGLYLSIYPNNLGGNVDIINGLNHYIGMKTLHTEDFVEFTVLPYLIGFFAAFFFLVAILLHRKLMQVLLILFVSFGVIAMIDFWRWEYNYGHNLDPNAAIIVPGMAYQPPLIGFKQLLNFGAYSVPDIGGWLFIIAGSLLLFCVIMDLRFIRKLNTINSAAPLAFIILFSVSVSACNVSKEPIKIGVDNCEYCKMTISDPRFGVEVITKKGKIFKYDEIHCMLSSVEVGQLDKNKIKEVYFADFCDGHGLVDQKGVLLLKSAELKSPMGGNIAAFSSKDSLNVYLKALSGTEESWTLLLK